MQRIHTILLFLLSASILSSCSALFGSKQDDQIDEVFEQGKIDPKLNPSNVGYVPVFPFFQNLINPVDIYVGYDELIYVVALNDETNPLDNELIIMDQKGTIGNRITINGATDVTMDRRLQVYVVGRVETSFGNRACVYRIGNTAVGAPEFVDTLIHPLCDVSRASTGNRFANDEAVQFTGVATLYDNTLYVTRTGPLNDVNSFVRPDNGVLVYDAEGGNIGYAQGLNPNTSGIKSSVGISSIATLVGPPQRLQGMSTSKDFIITLADQATSLEYRALGISVVDDPDLGTQYNEAPALLNFDYSKADRFLYESNRFKKPEDSYISPDNLQYVFIVDSGTDSLYVFTNQGYEGINPPANSGLRKQAIVSFGGPGADGTSSGPFSFNDPSGVCYFRRMVYVADKKNNRICRYKLSNDLE
ncbi:MAG: hypothetical protein V4651_03200 [Bacteroidota bacterium]